MLYVIPHSLGLYLLLMLPCLSSSPGCRQGCSSCRVPEICVLSLESLFPGQHQLQGGCPVVWLGRNGLGPAGSITGQPLSSLSSAVLGPTPAMDLHPATPPPSGPASPAGQATSAPPIVGTALARPLCKLAPSRWVCLLQTFPSRPKWSENGAGRSDESCPR